MCNQQHENAQLTTCRSIPSKAPPMSPKTNSVRHKGGHMEACRHSSSKPQRATHNQQHENARAAKRWLVSRNRISIAGGNGRHMESLLLLIYVQSPICRGGEKQAPAASRSLNAIIMQVGTSNISTTGPQRKIPNFKRRLLRRSTKIIIRVDARDQPLGLICTQHMGPCHHHHQCVYVPLMPKSTSI